MFVLRAGVLLSICIHHSNDESHRTGRGKEREREILQV